MRSGRRIEDYALIGDCGSAALVGRDGSIDWLCLPRFDSPACFAALLGEPKHGRWLIEPVAPAARSERRYLDGSLILATTFETAHGAVELIDFMRPHRRLPQLVRLVRGLRGRGEAVPALGRDHRRRDRRPRDAARAQSCSPQSLVACRGSKTMR